MSTAQQLQDDVFAIPRGPDRYYLYAPLRRSVAVLNGAGVRAVGRYLREGEAALKPSEHAMLATLRGNGFFTDPSPEPPIFPDNFEFRPHQVTLFPISRCNLRCRYCYADAGKKNVEMPWDVARTAIDVAAENAGWLGNDSFTVGFHGGGEPMMAWDLIVRCVEYAERKADETGLDVNLFAATNGLLSPRKREYLVEHFTTLNISLDGPEDIQDYYRPQANGKGSFRPIRDTLRFFDEVGFFYGVRATIMAETVARMEEIVEQLQVEFNLAYLHLEPVWLCGRCLTSGDKPPHDEDFVTNYLKAAAKGRELGVPVHYSGARLDVLTSKFCAAPGDGFNVLPEGIVTSCYEVTEADDPRAPIFHYGRYNAQTGAFEFDADRIEALQHLSVEHIPFCQDCFCKWHCAGDCLSKVFEASGDGTHRGSTRCALNRALTLAELDELIEQKDTTGERK